MIAAGRIVVKVTVRFTLLPQCPSIFSDIPPEASDRHAEQDVRGSLHSVIEGQLSAGYITAEQADCDFLCKL